MIDKLYKCIFIMLGFLLQASAAISQNPYAIAIVVNDEVVTHYEITQRDLMLRSFGATGNIREIAIQQLIDDRLYRHAAKKIGVIVPDEQMQVGMSDFAARGNFTIPEIIVYLQEYGVAAQTYRNFIKDGLLWRNVVRARFSRQALVSDQEMNVNLGQNSAAEGEFLVNISEIIIPHDSINSQQALDLLNGLSKNIKSQADFAAAARKYSQADSAIQGGDLGWINIQNLSASVVANILSLKPGQISRPIGLGAKTGLFQLHAIQRKKSEQAMLLNYAQVELPVGATALAQRLIDDSDICHDLRFNAKKLDNSTYTEKTAEESAISVRVAANLMQLDPKEAIYFTNNAGATIVLMLCSRTRAMAEDALDSMRNNLFNRKITGLGAGYLQELRSNAHIEYK